MQRFQFRLERALEWQRNQRKLAEEEVRLSLLAIAETDQRAATLKALRAAVDQDVITRPAVTAADLSALARFRNRAKRDAAGLARRKSEQVQVLDRHRVRLTNEHRRERLFEKLRERALSEYTRELDREMEALAAECHLARWTAQAGAI